MGNNIYILSGSILGLTVISLFILVLYYKKEIKNLKNKYNKMKILYDLACIDTVTGVYNRTAYDERLKELLRTANKDSSIYAIVLDIDHFKKINDCKGHHMGDEALKKTANAILEILDDDFEIFRIGGDEFSIIASGVTEEKVIKKLTEIDKLKNCPNFGMALSYGYSYADFDSDEPLKAAFIRADKNMYNMKKTKNALR